MTTYLLGLLKRDIYIPKTGTDDAVVDVLGQCHQSKHAVVCFDYNNL